jgi:hypothetical protein
VTVLRAIHARPAPPAPAVLEALPAELRRIRGTGLPDASVVIPVNAQGDVDHLMALLADLGRYDGAYRLEFIVVLNNYEADEEPEALASIEKTTVTVVAVPSVRRPGEAVSFTARIPGLRAAASDIAINFDSDVRVPYPTDLIDWYVAALTDRSDRVRGAYGPVLFHSVPQGFVADVAVAIHHASRWIKRTILHIPTLRGSAYAARRQAMLDAYDERLLADDMNVGPVLARGGRAVVHDGDPRLAVRTSGRMYGFDWPTLARYLRYRLRYNLRVIPVRPDAATKTGRDRDPVRRYVDDRPVLTR